MSVFYSNREKEREREREIERKKKILTVFTKGHGGSKTKPTKTKKGDTWDWISDNKGSSEGWWLG